MFLLLALLVDMPVDLALLQAPLSNVRNYAVSSLQVDPGRKFSPSTEDRSRLKSAAPRASSVVSPNARSNRLYNRRVRRSAR